MNSALTTLTRLICAMVFCFFFSLTAYPADLDKPYSPTRKEWLEISIFKTIRDRTDIWKQRISSIVWVKEEYNTVYITLTSANGQEPLSKESRDAYVEVVKETVESFLEKYEWSKNLKVFVQFI